MQSRQDDSAAYSIELLVTAGESWPSCCRRGRNSGPPEYCAEQQPAGERGDTIHGGARLHGLGAGRTTIAPRSWPTGLTFGPLGESCMRFILGIIIGCALTAGGAYIVDSTAATAADKMVNWEAVKKNIDTATALAREGWKKIAG